MYSAKGSENTVVNCDRLTVSVQWVWSDSPMSMCILWVERHMLCDTLHWTWHDMGNELLHMVSQLRSVWFMFRNMVERFLAFGVLSLCSWFEDFYLKKSVIQKLRIKRETKKSAGQIKCIVTIFLLMFKFVIFCLKKKKKKKKRRTFRMNI